MEVFCSQAVMAGLVCAERTPTKAKEVERRVIFFIGLNLVVEELVLSFDWMVTKTIVVDKRTWC
jgi:hypothetical protein